MNINLNDNRSESEDWLPDFLKDKKGENPFVVPHNYFRDLPDQVLKLVKEEERKDGPAHLWDKIRSMIYSRSLRPTLAIATILLVTVGYLYWLGAIPAIRSGERLTQEEITSYVMNNLEDFDEEFFYQEEIYELDVSTESYQDDEIEGLLNDLVDELDIETLQNIL